MTYNKDRREYKRVSKHTLEKCTETISNKLVGATKSSKLEFLKNQFLKLVYPNKLVRNKQDPNITKNPNTVYVALTSFLRSINGPKHTDVCFGKVVEKWFFFNMVF